MKRLLLVLMLGFCGYAYADEAQKVLDCMHANVPATLRVQDIELTTTDRADGARMLRGRLYALREQKDGVNHVSAMLRVYAPDNLAGSAFLMREATKLSNQGMYVYLPSVRRVRRVTGDFADGALLGTDFSYQDFKQLQNGFQNLNTMLEAPELIEQRPVYVLSSTPLPGSPSSYSRIRTWVDQKTCVPLKADFYQNQALRKQLVIPAAALKQSNNYWYPSEVSIRDVKAGTGSQLRVLGVESGSRISRGTFDPGLFYRIGN